MNSIFGQKIVMDEDNIRSLVWKIQALAYKFLKFGLINVLLLFVASFNMFSLNIPLLYYRRLGGESGLETVFVSFARACERKCVCP